MRATVIAHAVASLIVVAQPLAPANAQDTATAVSAATQNTPAPVPAVGSDTIRFGGRTIEAGDTVNGPVLSAAGDLRVRGVIRGTAVAIAGDIIVEDGGSITGDAIAILGSVVAQRGAVGGAARNFSRTIGWLDEVEQTPPPPRGTSDAMSLSLGWLVVMLLIGIGVLVFAGAYLDGVTDVLEQSFGRSFLVGIAGELGVIPVMLLVVAALAVTVVGILLIPFDRGVRPGRDGVPHAWIPVGGPSGRWKHRRQPWRGSRKGASRIGVRHRDVHGRLGAGRGLPVVSGHLRNTADDRAGGDLGSGDGGLRGGHPFPRRHESRRGQEGCGRRIGGLADAHANHRGRGSTEAGKNIGPRSEVRGQTGTAD